MERDERVGPGAAVAGPEPGKGTSRAAPDRQGLAAQADASRAAAGPAKPRRGASAARSAWAHPRTRPVPGLAPPTEAEVRRMVAEFQARGGQITVCRPVHLMPVQNGAGRDAKRWTA
ncbi:hypothetical protein GCM10010964_05570 [Caldovatus sediminis]|uniref:Uncharacterized protein n=1 Tax=Caldovatus sediminis TaxID=2041189 RepID=A0A8J3EAX3_9PROT|nr:hypothetical protein GCM10010964_05570 [Caldovatus sediminis]